MARTYTGCVKAIIADWSGTVADPYVIAPALAFVRAFEQSNVTVLIEEARGPMGLRKDEHIKALTEMPAIRDRWQNIHGTAPTAEDLKRIYADFVPIQLECIAQYATLLPGVADTVSRLRAYGIKIGSTTGFMRSMVDILLREAKKQGYVPDATVAGDDVANGTRPKPFMIYRNLELLDVHPLQAVIKIDDTASGIEEGLEAGCWTVGIARYSNYMNINAKEQVDSLSKDELAERLGFARSMLAKSGAHYTINEFPELLNVVEDVNGRLSSGENP